MRKSLKLAVSFVILFIGLTGVLAPPAAAAPECACPANFYRYCRNHCGAPVCDSVVTCVTPGSSACNCECIC